MNPNSPIGYITNAFQAVWFQVASLLPRLLSATLILIGGLIAASVIARLVRRLISYTRVDNLVQRTDVYQRLSENNVKVTISGATSWLVRWLLIFVTLIAVTDTLGLPQVTELLLRVMYYIPNVIVAAIILGIGFVIAQFMTRMASAALNATRLPEMASYVLSRVVKWSVVTFAAMAALVQLGIAPSLIQILFAGMVAMLAIAGGLAFGLGGKDAAGDMVRQLRKGWAQGGRR